MNHIKKITNRRIAVFEPAQDLTTNPTLTCLIKALTAAGAQVDVMMPLGSQYLAFNENINRYPFPDLHSLWKTNRRTPIRGLRETCQVLKLKSLFISAKYDVIIGINSEGIVKAHEFSRKFGIPLIYISFELSFRDEISDTKDIIEKQKECKASQDADLVIIQDELRSRLLANENSVPHEKFEFIPVAPSGSVPNEKTNYCRRRFSIPDSQTIVLHSGSFRGWTCAEELISNASLWPNDFTLMIHTRYQPKKNDTFIKMAHNSGLSNIILSTEPLSTDEYERLVASADIGLVLYKSVTKLKYTGKNIQNIGLSSGKFSFYMKHGLPVISYRQKSYKKLLLDYEFGENIESFNEMPEALGRIQKNYAHHCSEARRLYIEKLDFNIHWRRLSERILGIMS